MHEMTDGDIVSEFTRVVLDVLIFQPMHSVDNSG